MQPLESAHDGPSPLRALSFFGCEEAGVRHRVGGPEIGVWFCSGLEEASCDVDGRSGACGNHFWMLVSPCLCGKYCAVNPPGTVTSAPTNGSDFCGRGAPVQWDENWSLKTWL